MSGHSKWAQIKHQKASADKKRGKLFSVLVKRITLAARSDRNPETNPSLKLSIDKARAANMPTATIERAIKRGAGELPGQGPLEEVVYEAYGPEGVQLVIISTTDNRNRTTANVRHLLSKAGGSLSGSGSVLWNFERTPDEGYVAKTTQEIAPEARTKIQHIIESLEEEEDVEEVYTNV